MSLKSYFLRAILRNNNKFVNFASIRISNGFRQEYDQNEERTFYTKYRRGVATVLFSSVLIGSAVTDKLDNKHKNNNSLKPQNIENVIEAGQRRSDLPTYTAEEVSKHNTKKSFWVTYKHGVYDITGFLPTHPGGDQILNAAGYSIEPFWNVYGMHNTVDVHRLLESFRIGNLHESDIVDHNGEELWAKEPVRDPRLAVKTARPFNAEVPPKYQIQHFDTPNELFYVRQHMPVPELDPGTHQLTVNVVSSRKDRRSFKFSLKDLEKFPCASVRAALMCAGNRRSEMNKQVKPVKGISWTTGAIGNAVWTGVYLRDVLLHCGVDENDVEGKHVIFEGADIDATGVKFSTSIPLHMAMNPYNRVLLATHMNGAELPPDHGRPLRVVVPGAPAVRSAKWCESITVSTEESPSHWHQKDYRGFNPSTTWETADFSTAPPVYSLPVTSAICDPVDGETVKVKDGCIEVRGYAYSGGGAKILRVDVRTANGAWREAQLRTDDAPPGRHYSWALWTAAVPVEKGQKEVEIWVKATDSNFNTQPEKFDDIWNIRGILSNAYHKVKVKVQH